jgi:N-terminal domain of toast_rack, DUF2154
MSKTVSRSVFLGCGLALLVAGCGERGELITEHKIVASEGARSLNASLKMNAGELRLSGGARELMEARFVHRGRYRAPDIKYDVSGGKGFLTLKQQRSGFFNFGNSRNEWDIKLSSAIPADLDISLGAGKNTLDLEEVDIRSLDIDVGVGEVLLDLRGKRNQNVDVSIDGGIGSATIRLPGDIGVRAKVDGGIGSVEAPGFTKSGHVYTNEAYGKSPVTVDIKVDAGIGSIRFRLDGDDRSYGRRWRASR